MNLPAAAVVAVNLKGVFLSCQAAAKQMAAQKAANPAWSGGTIITLSSVNALMAIPTIAGYNASKGLRFDRRCLQLHACTGSNAGANRGYLARVYSASFWAWLKL